MKNIGSKLSMISVLALISGCGGGGGGDTVTPAPSIPSYEVLGSSTAATSDLGGVFLRSNGTTGALELVANSGTTTHDTGNTTITDGTYSLTDADGFAGGNTLTDGSSTIAVDTSTYAGTYEFVAAYEQSYTVDGVTFDSTGFGGIITAAQDIPATGTATYVGGASGTLITATQGFDLNAGTSQVTANFGSGNGVDVTLTDFTSIDQTNGNATAAPIDTIAVNGMTITGNGFSGGTITTKLDGDTISVTGANTTSAAQGAFYGYSTEQVAADGTISSPDEVGGLILVQGDDGILTSSFIAD